MITERELSKAGYTLYKTKSPAFLYDRLWQKKIGETYINIMVYLFPKELSLSSNSQFYLPNDRVFNVEYFIDKNSSIFEVEEFFVKIYKKMECINGNE